MFIMLISACFVTMIVILLPMISLVIFKKSNMDMEKMSPFECGFNPKSNARTPFSLRFFLLAVLFLIFDVEITLLLPVPLVYFSDTTWNLLNVINIFVIILLLGVLLEWYQGSLDWSN